MYKLLALSLLVCSFAFKLEAPWVQPEIIYKVYTDGEWVEQELEKRPEFRTGDLEIFRFLGMNARYPVAAQRAKVSGTALVTAEVTEDGKLINEKIEKDLGAGLGQETLRVVQLMPDEWTPGTRNGEPIRVQVTIPVTFRLM